MPDVRRKEIESILVRLDTRLTVHLYNGLKLENGSLTTGEHPENKIDKAYEEIRKLNQMLDSSCITTPFNLPDAEDYLTRATDHFTDALNSSSKMYRMRFVTGFFYQIYLTVLIGALAYLFASPPTIMSANELTELIPLPNILLGAIGAVFYAIIWVWVETSRGRLRKEWEIRIWFSPIYGAVAGSVVFLILQAGLLLASISIVGRDVGVAANPLENSIAMMVLSFVAGYRWRWIAGLMDKIARNVDS